MKRRLIGLSIAAILSLASANIWAQTQVPAQQQQQQQRGKNKKGPQGTCNGCPNGGVQKRDGTGPGMKRGNQTGPRDGTGPIHTPSQQGGGRRGGGGRR